MRNLFTEEWLKTLKQLGSELPSMDLTVTCQYEISGAPQGKVRYYIDIQKGKITDAELGKHPSPNCSISTTYKEVSSILQQEKSVTASFMQGNFKIDWVISPTFAKIHDKDFRVVSFQDEDGVYSYKENTEPKRIWRTNDESNYVSKLNFSKKYILFDNPMSSVTSGQFVTWYIEDELIGSGIIS